MFFFFNPSWSLYHGLEVLRDLITGYLFNLSWVHAPWAYASMSNSWPVCHLPRPSCIHCLPLFLSTPSSLPLQGHAPTSVFTLLSPSWHLRVSLHFLFGDFSEHQLKCSFTTSSYPLSYHLVLLSTKHLSPPRTFLFSCLLSSSSWLEFELQNSRNFFSYSCYEQIWHIADTS